MCKTHNSVLSVIVQNINKYRLLKKNNVKISSGHWSPLRKEWHHVQLKSCQESTQEFGQLFCQWIDPSAQFTPHGSMGDAEAYPDNAGHFFFSKLTEVDVFCTHMHLSCYNYWTRQCIWCTVIFFLWILPSRTLSVLQQFQILAPIFTKTPLASQIYFLIFWVVFQQEVFKSHHTQTHSA